MNSNNKKGPVIEGGTCRCCGVTKKCRLLNIEYEFCGQTEIYFEMFVDCFGLVLSHLEGDEKERLICATCVMRLRDACAFRKQVLLCEEKLLQLQMQVDDESNRQTSKFLVKVEIDDTTDIYTDDGPTDCGQTETEAENNIPNIPQPILLSKIKTDIKEEKKPPAKMAVRRKLVKRNAADTLTAAQMRLRIKRMREKLIAMHKRKADVSPLHISDIKGDIKKETNSLDRKPVKRRLVKKKINETGRAKKEMLTKMKKMREKLRSIKSSDTDQPVPATPGKWKSANTKAFHNLTTLVENSFVCPFVTTFSNFFCVYCREMFTDPDKLREHTQTHDPRIYQDTVTYKRDLQIDIARIDCRLCPEPIDNLETFYKHITSIHNKHLYPNIKNEFLKFHLRLGTLSCLECGGSYTNFHALKRHMAEHFGTCICDICGGHFFDENKLIIHQRSHQEKTNNLFPCKDCGKLFKSKHGMYYHVSRAHSAEPTFHCYKCDEVLFSQTLRYRHMIEVHGETARKFPCDNCNKVYDTKKSLREHVRKNHLKVLKHECSVCERKFYLPSALKDHMASHTGERNFRCEYCGKSYPRLRALRVHMQSHETEKRYKCSLCSASYTQSNNLKNHMKTKHMTSDYLPDLQ